MIVPKFKSHQTIAFERERLSSFIISLMDIYDENWRFCFGKTYRELLIHFKQPEEYFSKFDESNLNKTFGK